VVAQPPIKRLQCARTAFGKGCEDEKDKPKAQEELAEAQARLRQQQ
jgi:hypothetical protein